MTDIPSPFDRLRFFCLLNFPLFFIIFLLYGALNPAAFSLASWAYFIVLSLVHAGLSCFLFLFVLPALVYFLSYKWLKPIMVSPLIASFGQFFLCVDLFCYSQFQTHINAPILAMILSPARAEIFDLTGSEYFSLGFVLGSLLFLQFILSKLSKNCRLGMLRFLRAGQYALIFLFLASQGIYAFADAAYKPQFLKPTELIPGFWGLTAKRFLARHHLVPPVRQQGFYSNNSKLHYPLNPLKIKKIRNKPNILVIAIDAWRFDSLTSAITPRIFAHARQFCNFKAHYSGGNCTRSGIFSLFYSVNPADFDAFYRAGKGPVLFDVLKQQGYKIGIFPSASALSPPFHRTVFVNVPEFNPATEGIDSVARDKAVTQKVKEFTTSAVKAKKPFFAFVFYDSAHAYQYPENEIRAPFQPAQKVNHLNLHRPDNQYLYRNQYQNALFFVDSLVGDVLEDLQMKDAFANTFIIITSDHGEEFNDNGKGYWGHNSNFTPAQTRVPLLVHWPRQQMACEITHITSHYDIVPTLLAEVLGVKNATSDYALGFSLMNSALREVILMASYGKLALFLPLQNSLVIINRWGLYSLYDLKDNLQNKVELESRLYKNALAQMNRFH